jgi:hypothetical protein
MELPDWALPAVFLGLGLLARDAWDFGKRRVREYRQWLASEEWLRVYDAAEDMGYRLDVCDEQTRLSFYEDAPGRQPPRFIQRLYHWWNGERYHRKLQSYTDINGLPPSWLT